MQPCYDREHRLCLQVARTGDVVSYIPLSLDGLEVVELPAAEFDRQYQPSAAYPAARCAALLVGYARDLGASEEALTHLGRVVNITKQEHEMATAKKAARKTPAVKPNGAAKKSAKRASATPGEKKLTAAQLFKDLIMEGGMTDDQIFKKVQAKFGLSDDKKGYTKWYRNALKKEGKRVPAAKE